MKLTECKVSQGWLQFKVESISDAIKLSYRFKPGDYDLTPHKAKRSRNANDYAWTLMTMIANKLGISPVDVYQNEIRDVNPKVRFIYIMSETVDEERKHWIGNHLGRDLQILEDNGTWAYCMESYGSSDFDTAEMSKLIENILQDCRELEIETRDPEHIKSLLMSWQGR